ncbi:hypothetical protein Nmel_012927 [Mimus melanotis]
MSGNKQTMMDGTEAVIYFVTRKRQVEHQQRSSPLAVPQRRVTFHLPDGSQESCSDSGLGDHEPTSGASTSHPLPLGFPQDEFYEQASPNSRTEGDGNSDPESSNKIILLLFGEKIEYDWVSQEIGQSKSHDCSLGTESVEGKPENLKVICN